MRCAGRAAIAAGAMMWAILAAWGPARAEERARLVPVKGRHVPEVRDLLTGLSVGRPRTYKNMAVFPLRYQARQIQGDWETLDQALDAGHLKILEKDRATVSQVRVENLSEKSIFLMSGEIIRGGKQTRVIAKDTILEPRQKVTLPVLCVERNRWHGGKRFVSSRKLAPSSIAGAIQRGEGQSSVWLRVKEQSRALGVQSRTESLDEVLESDQAQEEFRALHEELGRFSPPHTVGIAIADLRTGRVIGLEVFGRRDLFEDLQDKLVEGYAADLVLVCGTRPGGKAEVTQKDILAFIRRALSGRSAYEDTPGSGRGLDVRSRDLRGKGVALAGGVVHLSVQRTHRSGVRPIVEERPLPARPRVR